ncbi:MAG TPA: hypothetical protein VEN47_02795 [Myxococcota bacterium]|nr:hypothetical protein [Myxococcota bacterium]
MGYTLVSAIVGVRLIARSVESRGVPELLAGLSYIAAPALGYPMCIVAPMISNRTLSVPVYVTGEVFLVSGCCCFLFFTVKVFRPGMQWAYFCAAVGSAVLVWSGIGITRAFLSSTVPAEVAELAKTPLAAMVLVLMLSYVWTALEGMRYYRMMRKRMALGLADAVVTNRFLLWGFSGLTSLAWISVSAFFLAIGANIGTDPIPVTVTSAGGIVNTVFLVLIFMPPSAYTRWVERSARAGALATV